MDHELCDACGFNGGRYDDPSLIAALEELGTRWRTVLAGAGPELRTRPEPGVWSALEYAAHSRDVTALHVYGVEQALTGAEPEYPAIEGDNLIESAAASYLDADAKTVVDDLDAQARGLARAASEAGSDSWERGITIGGSRSTVRRLLEHALHDSLHHVDDVERGFRRLRQRPRRAGG